jgi:hypothetical protein
MRLEFDLFEITVMLLILEHSCNIYNIGTKKQSKEDVK